jgi:predicted glycoside hydrolase/deacetylase ChbG (UPF0249 family)
MPWLMLPGRRSLLEREIRLQIQSMLERGLKPTHLDSHQHVHVISPIWGLCRRLATEFGIGRIRTPFAPVWKDSLAGSVLQKLSKRRALSQPAALACIGIAHAGHNTGVDLENELEMARGRDVELVAHPAFDTPSIRERYGFWKFDWETERAALLGDALGEACMRLGYRITRLSDRA